MIATSEAVVASTSPGMSPIQRLIAVFIRPASAWTGLHGQVQWWFPLLLILLVNGIVISVLHERVLVPMALDQMEQSEAPPERLDSMEQFFSGPGGRLVFVGQQFVVIVLMLMITAALLNFGCGFMLGRKLGFRLGLEVACWAGLVTIPAMLVTSLLAWQRGTFEGIHLGFGVLVAGAEPNRVTTMLASFLDALGPLALWNLAVMIIGASTLSGADRKSTTWTLGGIYLAVVLALSALGAFMRPA
jgi:hypothetical protein